MSATRDHERHLRLLSFNIQAGAEATATTPEEFATFVRSESEKWRRVAEAAGVRVD